LKRCSRWADELYTDSLRVQDHETGQHLRRARSRANLDPRYEKQ